MYYVYILASRRHGTLYIGVTNSLQKRLAEHRDGDGSSFVKTYGVHRLVYVESYDRPDEAIALRGRVIRDRPCNWRRLPQIARRQGPSLHPGYGLNG